MFTEEERKLFSALSDRIQQEKDPSKLVTLVEELQALIDRAAARENTLLEN
jgi:hypothetical protein